MKNLAHRTVANAIFNTMSWVIPIGLSFIILPYIVSQLGTESYGILTLVLTVIGYLSILDLGLGNAVIKYVAEYNAKGDVEKMNEVIGSVLLVLFILSLAGSGGLLLVADPLATSVLKIPAHLVPVAYAAFCLGALGFFSKMLLSVFSSIPNGFNRYDITSAVNLIIGTFTMVATAILLSLGFGLLQIVWLNIFVTASGVLVYAIILKRLMPAIRFGPCFRFPVIKKVFNFGKFSVLSRVSYLVNYQADRFITGIILGVSSVTYYVVPFMMVSRITDITNRIGMVIFPAVSELQGQKNYGKITDLYLVSSRVILTIATSICLPLIVFGERLLTLWMGSDFAEGSGSVIVLVTLGLYISSLTNIPTFVVDGMGMPKVSGLAAIANAIINLSLVIPLAKHIGIEGVSAAFLASNALVAPIFIWYVNTKVLKISLQTLFFSAYVEPLIAGVLILVPLSFVPQDHIPNIYALLSLIGLSSLGYVLLCYLMGIFPHQVESMFSEFLKRGLRRNENTVS